MQEGIALYGVPDARIVEELLRAGDEDSRRQLLVSKWAEIGAACSRKLREISEVPECRDQASYALELVSAIDQGFHAAAQALAASMVDSFTMQILGKADRHKYARCETIDKVLAAYDGLPMRKAFALFPLWQAYQRFFPEKGDPVPTLFNRHATAHTINPKQFTQINAITGALFAVSLLCYLSDEACIAGSSQSRVGG